MFDEPCLGGDRSNGQTHKHPEQGDRQFDDIDSIGDLNGRQKLDVIPFLFDGVRDRYVMWEIHFFNV